MPACGVLRWGDLLGGDQDGIRRLLQGEAVLLGTTRLDVNKKVSELLAVKRLSFAGEETTLDLTGMMIGGVTAFGIGELPIYVDGAVMEQAQVVMGGGNRSSKLLLNPRELTKLPNVVVVEGLAKPK